MREILLVRHGVPDCDHRSPIRGRDFARWVREYDAAPLDRTILPPAVLRARASAVSLVVTSTMRRSLESARVIAPDHAVVSDPLLNEAGIPTALDVPLALRPLHWDAIARLAWLVGWAGGAESVVEARGRATDAATHLAGLAARHGSVMLVGHGMLNSLIARALRRAGWTGSGLTRRYWGSVSLRR
jgi:broad specificity phosphatase PhoE